MLMQGNELEASFYILTILLTEVVSSTVMDMKYIPCTSREMSINISFCKPP